jgi:methyltransferase-like protein
VKRSEYATSQIHKIVRIDDPLSRRLVELLDGNRNEVAITQSLLEFVRAGQVELRENGALLTHPEQIEAAVIRRVPDVLKAFAREGLLVG